MVSTMTSVEKVKIPEGYKQTEVGVIPEDWSVTALSSQLKENPKYGINAAAVPLTGNLPVYLRITDISEDGYFKPSTKVGVDNSFSSLYNLDAGDLVVARTGASVGKSYLYRPEDGELIYAGFLIKLSPDQNKLKSDFLFQYLRSESYWAWVVVMSMRSGQPGINGVEYGQLPIPLPSPEEQTAIANALSDVDNLIASLETLIAKKSAIKTAAMQQLLTGKKRLPAFVKESEEEGAKQSSELDSTSETAQAAETKQASTLNSDLYEESDEGLDSKLNQQSDVSNANNKQTAPRPGYKQTELGEIPEDWEVKPLGELLSFKNGLNKAKEYFGYGLPIVNYMDVYSNPGIASANIKGMVDVTKEEVAAYSVKKGDVFFTRTSETVNEIGLSTVLLDDIDSGVFSGFVLRAREKSDQLNLMFKKYCFSSYYIRKQIGSTSSYTTRALTNGSLLSNVELIFPSCKKEQAAIANVLSDMDTELDALQQRLSKTQKIKLGMMQELLTGKTRLPFASDAKASS